MGEKQERDEGIFPAFGMQFMCKLFFSPHVSSSFLGGEIGDGSRCRKGMRLSASIIPFITPLLLQQLVQNTYFPPDVYIYLKFSLMKTIQKENNIRK